MSASSEGGAGGAMGGGSGSTATSTTAAHSTVAAKITHLKPDGSLAGQPGSISITGTPVGGTIMTGGTIKVATGGGIQTSISGTPIALNTGQATTSASIRAIGGQSTQVRVVMPMIKQMENVSGTGRTQITAIPAAPARSVSNASITVTRPVTQATYLPRAGVTATQMSGIGVTTAQRLVTPLRATATSSVSASVTPVATGLTSAGSFVRGTAVNRSNVSQPSTVISSANNAAAAWMQGTTGQVQLIRAIHQQRHRITTTGGAAGQMVSGPGLSNVAVSGSIMTTTTTPVQTPGGATALSVTAGQAMSHTPQTGPSGTPQAYVATVLPPRQHQATLVYSSNMAAPPNTNPNAGPQFNPSVAAAQRFAVATPLGTVSATTPGGTTVTPRSVRPIPLGKSFATNISIRTPSIPQLTASLAQGSMGPSTPVSVSSATVTGRNVGAAVSVAPVLTTANLPTTRIIQLQQPATGTAQQIIGSTARLTGNVMLQPFIMSTAAAKMGGRIPVTMTAKVQPSLTITQLPIGKLSTGGSGTAPPNLTTQGVASIQALGSGTSSTLGTPTVSVGGATVTPSGTQLVNVSQGVSGGAQLLSASNLVTAGAGTAAAGGATVLPLAISTRGGPGTNILTGALTPLKNTSGIKMMMTQAAATDAGSGIPTVSVTPTGAPTSVFIQQRAGSTGSGVTVSAAAAGVATSSAAGSFLPSGSATIYYESMPASSVQVSTGVLSLTTTTVTQSTHTHSQAQLVSSAGNLSVSSLPFVSHAGTSGGSTATFTVVPSATGARTIGQIQLPGATRELGSTLVQATAGQQLIIPIHTSVKVTTGAAHSGHATTGGGAIVSAVPVSSAAGALVSNFMRKREADGSPIRAAKNLAPTLLSMSSNTQSGTGAASSGVSATLTAVNLHAASSGAPPGTSYNIQHANVNIATSLPVAVSTSALTVEALAKKDRAAHVTTTTAPSTLSSTRNVRANSPDSSDGSTTVSANSSPGVEQQMQDSNLVINRIGDTTTGAITRDNATHFNPINEMYSSHHVMQPNIAHASVSARAVNAFDASSQSPHQPTALPAHVHSMQLQQQTSLTGNNASARMNGGTSYECPPRKKTRRSTNDSQHSTQSQASLTLPPPTGGSVSSAASGSSSINAGVGSGMDMYMQQNNGLLLAAASLPTSAENNHRLNSGTPAVAGNKENANPVDFVLRRPRNFALLNTYKPTHKLANNHFHRYTDVKPREERRATVNDLANQPNVQGKINGWKIFHLRAQMEDLNESEEGSLNKLETMLKELEKDKDKHTDIERISELLKGNIQRSKIITEGINEAQNQIMKIFEHKPHVSDIINRCASKRNFKKREKI